MRLSTKETLIKVYLLFQDPYDRGDAPPAYAAPSALGEGGFHRRGRRLHKQRPKLRRRRPRLSQRPVRQQRTQTPQQRTQRTQRWRPLLWKKLARSTSLKKKKKIHSG